MNQLAKLGVCLSILLLFTGCMKYRTNTKPILLGGNEVANLNVSNSVTLKNGSSNPGEVIIGKWIGWTVYGDYYKFTETAIGTAKSILAGQNIAVEKDAIKSLELNITEAVSQQGAWIFGATVEMFVKTGSGINKDYIGIEKYLTGYGTTRAIESAIARCVRQMFEDNDIINYLRN
jgi:hypothetical protein